MMPSDAGTLINIVVNITLLAIAVVLLFTHKTNNERAISLIKIILVIEPIRSIWLIENKIESQLFLPTSFILICLFYYYVFKRRYLTRFLLLLISFTSIPIYHFLNPTKSNQVEIIAQSFTCITALLFSLHYYENLIVELPVSYLYHLPMFWFNTAMFFYYGGVIVLIVMSIILYDRVFLNFFQNWLGISKSILILIGIHHHHRQLKNNINT